MKNLICLLLLAAVSVANAQDTLYTARESQGYTGNKTNRPFIWSIGVEPSIPLGNFSDFSGFGLGASLQGEYKPGKALGITLNGGYIDYFGKTVNGEEIPDFKYWPVMAGLKWYPGEMFYIHGQAGPGFGTNGLGTSFWYGGGVGVNLGKALDAELKYTGWKQNEINGTKSNSSGGGTGPYGGGTGDNGGGSGGGNPYGGHYPTIGLRLAYNFR